MSPRELELRKRFRDEYGPASELFFQRIADVGFTEKELWAVPALFLPGCGNLYAQSLVKVAIVGEGTNYWKDSLLTDLDDRKKGKYELEFSFEVLQRESCERKGHLADGPTKWKNPFWKAVAEVLNTVYSTHDPLTRQVRFSGELRGATPIRLKSTSPMGLAVASQGMR